MVVLVNTRLVNTRLVNTRAGRYVVLAFTDTEQPAREIVRFYQLRFQIELIFRDAKQLAGLCHCQARSQEKIDFHLNMSLAAVNVARLEILLYRQVESMNSYVRRAYNARLVHPLPTHLSHASLCKQVSRTDRRRLKRLPSVVSPSSRGNGIPRETSRFRVAR